MFFHSFDLVFNHQQNQTVNNMFAGGRRGCRGTPSNEAFPCAPGKRTCIACAWGPVVGSWRGTHPRSSFISFRATSFLCVWRSKGPNLTPYRSCHSVLFLYAIPAVWRTWYQNFHLISFFIIIIIHIILQLASVFAFPDLFSLLFSSAESVSVCVCACVCVRVCM